MLSRVKNLLHRAVNKTLPLSSRDQDQDLGVKISTPRPY